MRELVRRRVNRLQMTLAFAAVGVLVGLGFSRQVELPALGADPMSADAHTAANKLTTLKGLEKFFYLKRQADSRYLKIRDAANIYIKQSAADARYIKLSQADARYIKMNDADARYLKLDDAAAQFLKIDAANQTFIKLQDADARYIKMTDADARYLKLGDAAAQFLKIDAANQTFIKLQDADARYIKMTDADARYLKLDDAAAQFLKIDAANSQFLKIDDANQTFIKLQDANTRFVQGSGQSVVGSREVGDQNEPLLTLPGTLKVEARSPDAGKSASLTLTNLSDKQPLMFAPGPQGGLTTIDPGQSISGILIGLNQPSTIQLVSGFGDGTAVQTLAITAYGSGGGEGLVQVIGQALSGAPAAGG
jgi:uncharacterized protein YjbI with pentapeptide repeats